MGPHVESFQPLSPFSILYDAFHRLHAHHFHWQDMEWNPKYASHVYKVTVAVEMLGNIIWICPLAPLTSTDVLIWDGIYLLVPEVIYLISKLGAMMVLIKAGFMSLCH